MKIRSLYWNIINGIILHVAVGLWSEIAKAALITEDNINDN